MKKLLFSELEISQEILKAVEDLGFEESTPIQSLSIPLVMSGIDVIGQAQTGTGKTAAFGIPMLESIDVKNKNPQGIVLCPTRELAIQVAEELNKLAKYKKGVKILPVYGGQHISRQIMGLTKGVHIVIGTPGRTLDHIRRETLNLDAIQTVVLDEADEMLDMGFRDDIEGILKTAPSSRQTVFFSATMPSAFMALTKRFQKNPKLIKIAHEKMTAPDIEQIYFETNEGKKLEALTRIIDVHDIKLSIIFCNTKRKVDDLMNHLQVRGYFCDALHGDMNQAKRDRVMGKFRKGAIEILIATDVAARGIDVENVEAVFNYDVPQDEEYYIHRIGRTGRAGKFGRAFTLATGKDMYKLRSIQRYAKIKIHRGSIPSIKDVEQLRINQFFAKVKDVLENQDTTKYTNMVEHLVGNEYTTLEVSGALLSMIMEQQSKGQTQKTKTVQSSQKSVRLFMNIGRKQNIRPGDILGAIAGEAGIDGDLIGNIDIYESYSFVNVPADQVENVIESMEKSHIKGKKIAIEVAKEKK
ncbi:DEAD/DEAH box helicase [bacterium]